jgi:[ribosomal protein S18]-alanine N-acetyltransferase
MIDTYQNVAGLGEADYPPRIIITRMRVEDIEHVSRLERRCYSMPWSSSAYVTEIGNPNAYYTVAKDYDGKVLGYAGMWVVMGEMHITTIAVDPSRRGERIGERLLIDLFEYAMAHGGDRTTLEVREHNRAARNLYLKYGFIEVAIRRNYYSDNSENAIVMWLNDLFEPTFLARLRQNKRAATPPV